MTTKLLKGFSGGDAGMIRAALSALAREYLPEPPLEIETLDVPDQSLLSAVRIRLCEIIGAPTTGALTLQQRSAAIDLISESLSAAIIVDTGRDVRTRLGDKGLLSPRQYKVVFSDAFKSVTEPLGIRRAHVTAVINNPDAVEHIHLREAKEGESFSLFAKTFADANKEASRAFTLLVVPRREGEEQIVGDAYRIYHDDIPINPGSTPLDLLRAFVSKYGCAIRVGEAPASKFLFDQVVPLGERRRVVEVLRDQLPPGTEVKVNSIIRVSRLQVIEVALAYGIDITRYREMLISRGGDVQKASRR
jgi:hypothetical protein